MLFRDDLAGVKQQLEEDFEGLRLEFDCMALDAKLAAELVKFAIGKRPDARLYFVSVGRLGVGIHRLSVSSGFFRVPSGLPIRESEESALKPAVVVGGNCSTAKQLQQRPWSRVFGGMGRAAGLAGITQRKLLTSRGSEKNERT